MLNRETELRRLISPPFNVVYFIFNRFTFELFICSQLPFTLPSRSFGKQAKAAQEPVFRVWKLHPNSLLARGKNSTHTHMRTHTQGILCNLIAAQSQGSLSGDSTRTSTVFHCKLSIFPLVSSFCLSQPWPSTQFWKCSPCGPVALCSAMVR